MVWKCRQTSLIVSIQTQIENTETHAVLEENKKIWITSASFSWTTTKVNTQITSNISATYKTWNSYASNIQIYDTVSFESEPSIMDSNIRFNLIIRFNSI